jgi:phenylacetic acid degradation operon negative regulatory protein
VLADVKKQLLWQGFGALAPSLLASPSQKLADVQSLLHEAGVAENVICFEAHSPLAFPVRRCAAAWRSAGISPNKTRCMRLYLAIPTVTAAAARLRPAELTPERCFQIQLLLIHFYRRVVLKDPLLPEELLPAHWAGQTARQLCINIYQRIPARWRSSARVELGGRASGAGPALLSALWRFAGRIRRLHADLSD